MVWSIWTGWLICVRLIDVKVAMSSSSIKGESEWKWCENDDMLGIGKCVLVIRSSYVVATCLMEDDG